MKRAFLLLPCLIVFGSCADPQDPVQRAYEVGSPLLLVESDASFRLPEADRARLRGDLDPETVEDFLAGIRAPYRDAMLNHLNLSPSRYFVQVETADPRLEDLLTTAGFHTIRAPHTSGPH